MKVLDSSFLGNPLLAWLLTGGVAIVCLAAGLTLRAILRRRLHRHAGRSEAPAGMVHTALDGILSRTFAPFLLAVVLAAARFLLVLPARWEAFLLAAVIAALAAQAALWVHWVITAVTEELGRRAALQNPGSTSVISSLGLLGKSVLWLFVGILVLHNAGVNITALVAGLGIGGIAIAMALQNILADVFASISILLDKPYEVGDFIIVGDSMGTVERIGVKTTRLRSQGGEQLVFSNGELLKSRIRNFKRLTERRVEFTIGVAYPTPSSKVELISPMIREIIANIPRARLERIHFKEFGDSALNFEGAYAVADLSYAAFLDVQESINLEILRRFEEEEIELAHPTRTLYVAQGVAPVKW